MLFVSCTFQQPNFFLLFAKQKKNPTHFRVEFDGGGKSFAGNAIKLSLMRRICATNNGGRARFYRVTVITIIQQNSAQISLNSNQSMRRKISRSLSFSFPFGNIMRIPPKREFFLSFHSSMNTFFFSRKSRQDQLESIE